MWQHASQDNTSPARLMMHLLKLKDISTMKMFDTRAVIGCLTHWLDPTRLILVSHASSLSLLSLSHLLPTLSLSNTWCYSPSGPFMPHALGRYFEAIVAWGRSCPDPSPLQLELTGFGGVELIRSGGTDDDRVGDTDGEWRKRSTTPSRRLLLVALTRRAPVGLIPARSRLSTMRD